MRRQPLFGVDWYLLLPVVALSIISLTTLSAVNVVFFRGQLLYFVIGLVAFFLFSQVDYKIFSFLIKPIYIASIILLVIVLLLGLESRGAVRWIDILGIRIQFSEIIKPFVAVCLSGFLIRGNSKSFRHFFMSGVLLFPIAFLIALQPDLGNALIFVIVLLFVLFVYGFPFFWFGIAILPFVLLSPILWTFLHDYQKERILSFLHPTSDPLGTTYNVTQAIIAVGSGTLFGRGLSESTQSTLRFLPERHTDFIFATISEGFGFIGAIVIIVAFAFLLYRLIVLFQNAQDYFGKLYILTVFFFFLVQFFLNIGMNLGIIPVVGVTLPFVSFGGSSILSSFIMIGIASSIANQTKVRVLEIS